MVSDLVVMGPVGNIAAMAIGTAVGIVGCGGMHRWCIGVMDRWWCCGWGNVHGMVNGACCGEVC